MIEYCYRLNLPSIDQVFISFSEIQKLLPSHFKGSKILYPRPDQIFKSHWLSYKDISWDYVSLFFRSGNEESMIHRDNPNNPNSLHWGINWISGENSIMEFWDDDLIEKQKIIQDGGGKTTVVLETTLQPSYRYTMSTGAYLINASIPHKITNLSNDTRIAVSLRSQKFRYENPSVAWRDIVEMFKSEII